MARRDESSLDHLVAAWPLSSSRPLTKRERQIVVLRCRDGLTQDEAGRIIGISVQTVKNHSTIILLKLGASSMSQACWMIGIDPGPISEAIRSEEV